MAHVKHMAQRPARHLCRQQRQKFQDLLPFVDFAWRQLPQQRAERVAQPVNAAFHESSDRLPRLTQIAPLGRIARRFERQLEASRHLVGPGRKRGGFLTAIERAIDLDRAHLP